MAASRASDGQSPLQASAIANRGSQLSRARSFSCSGSSGSARCNADRLSAAQRAHLPWISRKASGSFGIRDTFSVLSFRLSSIGMDLSSSVGCIRPIAANAFGDHVLNWWGRGPPQCT